MLHKLGVRSRYEIEGAVSAAARRCEAGADTQALYEFLLLRLES